MSDLISRSELIKELRADGLQPTKDTSDFIDGWCEGWNAAVDIINNQPTAYNVEKVVEQLEELEVGQKHCASCDQSADCKDSLSRLCVLDAKFKAIDIVRAGGKE